jgi:death-on-curing protein
MPFVDGSKRISHAAMELLRRMNGVKITGSVDEQERMFIALASSQMQRDKFTEGVRNHIQPL